MKHAFRCVTNNPLLAVQDFPNLEYHDTDVLGLLRIVYQEVIGGVKLLTHPLTGSIRPDITPSKTVLLSATASRVDFESVRLMERALQYTEDLYHLRDIPLYKQCSDEAKADFQLIDLSIIERALEVAQWS